MSAPAVAWGGGRRRYWLSGILAVGMVSAWWLGLRPADLVPGSGGMELAGKFFSGAARPAVTYEAAVPPGTQPIVLKALEAAWTTVKYAAAATGVALVLGLGLGIAGSGLGKRHGGRALPRWRTAVGLAARGLSTAMRSVHELVWAVLFLAAMGLTPVVAVVAIVIPYAGTFGKIFAEMIDEADDSAAAVMRAQGAGRVQVLCFGVLPTVSTDLVSYFLYRFECGLRSAAVMGFMGVETLGYFIRLSFATAKYHEMWTYLYVLLAVVALFDVWSGAVRRRLSA